MDFALTEEQQLLRDTARGLLEKECPPSLVRAYQDDRTAADGLWKRLSEWLELGQGPLVDLCLFLEELGAVVAPGPFFSQTVLWAPLALEGSGTVWFADDPTMPYVLDADSVDKVAVANKEGVTVVDTAALTLTPVDTIDWTRNLSKIEEPPSERAGTERAANLGEVSGLLERACVTLAAEMVGTARTLLHKTIAYAKERRQFDRPIGSFQAIQHKLADMALVWEQAWSAVYYAAMTIDADDPDRHRAAHVAKIMAGEAAKRAAKDGIQVHGGIGYTWEHDLHLFIRRAYGSEHLFGTADWHRDRLAELIL
jgi:alkylation response protein AidB-like acyl-CoA dehydrogenase